MSQLNAYSSEIIATVLMIFVIVVKTVSNCKVTTLQLKRTFVSVPNEITFLAISFLCSFYIMNEKGSGDDYEWLLLFVVAIIVFIIQVTVMRALEDNLSGHLTAPVIIVIIFTYAASVAIYFGVVFGGKGA